MQQDFEEQKELVYEDCIRQLPIGDGDLQRFKDVIYASITAVFQNMDHDLRNANH